MTGIMTTSRFPEITDELLSAYIDNAVTTGERLLIEQAASEDATVAWRLATLQETVSLLRSLPVLNAPRAFALTPEMVGQRRVEPAVTTGAVAHNDAFAQRQSARVPAPQPGWWERLVDSWQEFWTEGSPVWRNALTTSMAALLMLLMLPALLNGNTSRDFAVTPMASQVSQESAAAPASEVVTANEAAPASEAVAEMAVDATPAETVTAETVTAETVTAETVTAATAKQVAAADDASNNEGGEAVALAPAMAASVAEDQAPSARAVEGEAMAAPAEAEVVIASAEVTARTIPGERTTEAVLSGVASVESAPDFAAASAPPAPEFVSPTVASAAAPEAALLTAPPAGVTAAGASLASPQAPASAEAAAAMATAMPTATAISTATAAPTATATATAIAVAESGAEARAVTAAPAPAAPAAAALTPLSAPTSGLTQFLPWLQMAALAGVIAFGFLWWRSRHA
jgi:hypothetical protein